MTPEQDSRRDLVATMLTVESNGGHWCQNCSRVEVGKQGDVCEGCRELLERCAKQ